MTIETIKSELLELLNSFDTNKNVTIADLMESDIGHTEYDDHVLKIQKWYYGREVKDAWCATSLSYYANLAGVLTQTGKHENVDRMKDYMHSKKALFLTPFYNKNKEMSYKPKRGDVVFMSSKNIYADCTHVGVVSAIDNTVGTLCVCSGNINSAGRKDGIYLNCYNYLKEKYIVAFGAIEY